MKIWSKKFLTLVKGFGSGSGAGSASAWKVGSRSGSASKCSGSATPVWNNGWSSGLQPPPYTKNWCSPKNFCSNHPCSWMVSRAGNSQIRSLLIRSFAHFAQIKWATVSDLLRSLKTNEWPWANCSGRLEEMSARERISQFAQDKWATVSDLLGSLRGNEQMCNSLKTFWLKKSKILFFSMFYIRLFI